jgi:hypothetical protein
MSYWGQSLGIVFNIPQKTIFVKKNDLLGSIEGKSVLIAVCLLELIGEAGG